MTKHVTAIVTVTMTAAVTAAVTAIMSVAVTTSVTVTVNVSMTVILFLPAGDSVDSWFGSTAAPLRAEQPGTTGSLSTCHHR